MRGVLRATAGLVVAGLCVCVLAGCGGQASDDPADKDVFGTGLTLMDAQDRSAEEGKPALVFVQALRCPLCTRVRENALADADVIEAVDANTIAATISISERRLDPASQAELIRLDVDVVPTLMLFNGNEEIARIEGVVEADELLGWLESNGATKVDAGSITELDVGSGG